MSLARLFMLPTEIRALIFEYVVAEGQLVTFRLDSFQREYYQYATQPALTSVNRQVRCESLPIWYESNDFVLHTEGTKAADGRNWLQCNATYLPLLRRITFWVRYVPLTNNQRTSSQGAIGVSIYRQKKARDWLIDPAWSWITVVRKPAELDSHASLLVEKLKKLIAAMSTELAGMNAYIALVHGLKLYYLPISSRTGP
ncbi:hypothetical protein Slin15195_G012180 [Septoria linicola]|uniref:F-box domain-containing protein n=1 Tax=Septoria linicola TaxID=215465 RepID=A0A9Q9AE99_9PEZI|nr:hypothetical protein Slin14017_G012200 [Septoria linicola]USW47899.1 hypothetical protein Slin15195_G012180 [Septoria linicola]